MEIQWVITAGDEASYREFVERYKHHSIVQERVRKNIDRKGIEVSEAVFWKILVGCLLTTQQRSGAGSRVSLFLEGNDQLLLHDSCQATPNLAATAEATLTRHGIRRAGHISSEIDLAANWLKNGGWKSIEPELNGLLVQTNAAKERSVARILQTHLKGIGPKQSRNLIQWLGLSQYEIPLDSRVVKVLSGLHFPVPLSSKALADENYYCFIEDGIHKIMARISVIPCVFDACAFASLELNANGLPQEERMGKS
jgi:hypothetical protein